MSGIQSSVGLVSGLPIADIVEQLMSIAEQPRNRLETRMEGLKQEQLAITELTALTIGVQMATNKLANEALFTQTKATSSNSERLTATVTGSPVPGTYEFTPVQMAERRNLGVLLCPGHASLRHAQPVAERAGTTEIARIGQDLLLVGQEGQIEYENTSVTALAWLRVQDHVYTLDEDGITKETDT